MPAVNRDRFSRLVRRREALVVLGSASAGAIWQLQRSPAEIARAVTSRANAVSGCVLTPQVTEGPYWIDNKLKRRDITEGRPGTPLRVQLLVENASTCKPISGADVELWHADAAGVYSGYSGGGTVGPGGTLGGPTGAAAGVGHASPTNKKRFLRGHQTSDTRGVVTFDTIYPGWYSGRTTHIHVKVHVAGTVYTGQLFFPETTSDGVYKTVAYKRSGVRDTLNAADGIYTQAGRATSRLLLRKRSGKKGYLGTLTIGVKVA